MNNFTGELQAHFSQMNMLFNTVFKEIQSVYSVLDVLDKEYLTDITKSLNASVKAFEKAQSAQDDINKGVRVLEKTVGKLNLNYSCTSETASANGCVLSDINITDNLHSYKPPFCERHRWGYEKVLSRID